MEDATLETTGTRPAVRLERTLRQPPAVVWRALIDCEELAAWFPCDILTEEWKVGAALRFVFRGGEWHDLEGTVLEYDEPRVLAYTWGDDVLRFELEAAREGTRLVLINEVDSPAAARNAAGWESCLDRLEGRTPPPDGWQERFERYVAAFEPAIGHQDGPPQRP